MPAMDDWVVPVAQGRGAVRHALSAERARARRYHVALAEAEGREARYRCGRKLNASLGRATQLALALVDMGEAVPMTGACTEFDDRLLEAMDSSMRKSSARTLRRRSTGRSRRASGY